MACGTFLLSL
uniref:Uncharacterized protein n=1 Tax=Arundo donax TaxID=35708 RepID=A0A0A9H059_ARUDO